MTIEQIELPQKPNELAELEARRAKITAQRRMAENELAAAEDARRRAALGDDGEITKLANELASGERVSIGRVALPEELNQLRSRLAAFKRAENELVQQVANGRQRHHRQIAKTLQPLHRAAVTRVRQCLLALESANAEERKIRDIAPGYMVQACDFLNVGARSASDSPIRRWLAYVDRVYPDLDDEDEPKPPAKRSVNRLPRRKAANGSAEPAPLAAAPRD